MREETDRFLQQSPGGRQLAELLQHQKDGQPLSDPPACHLFGCADTPCSTAASAFFAARVCDDPPNSIHVWCMIVLPFFPNACSPLLSSPLLYSILSTAATTTAVAAAATTTTATATTSANKIHVSAERHNHSCTTTTLITTTTTTTTLAGGTAGGAA